MPKGIQYKAFMNTNKSYFKAECGFEIKGTPKNVSLKHKLHIKNCEVCKVLHTKPLNPNIYKDKTIDGKVWFHCNNEDKKNFTKFMEKKKEKENSMTQILVTEYYNNMTNDQYEKFRNTKKHEEDMKTLKSLLYMKTLNADVGIINPEFIDKQINSFNQFIIAEALGQIRQEMMTKK